MRRLVVRIAFAIVVLGLFAVFLISKGVWPTVVGAIGAGFGQEAAEKADEFGQTSKDITDRAQQALGEAEQALGNGDYGQLDYPSLGQLLRELPTAATAQRIPEYRRAEYGQAWADVDRNGCDTRNDILKRDLTDTTIDSRCRVLSGILEDPYTGKVIHFVRGEKTSPAIQIDHIFSLSESWRSGAWQWDASRREAFANDPLNLIAVDGPTNTAKSDKGPAEWMPPNPAFSCTYAARFVTVAAKYRLTVKPADSKTLDVVLAGCR